MFVVSEPAAACNFYVKNGGNNGLDGRSDANAWATIGKVNDYAENPGFSDGDVICLKRGSIWSNDEPIGYDGAVISWGTINGLTFKDYGTGDLPRLDCNTQQAILISSTAISNLTIKNINVSGMDWTYGNYAKDSNIRVHAVKGVTIDGIYCDGHMGTSIFRRHGSAIAVTRTSGDIEIKNCTLKNMYKDTFANSLAAWGSEDVHGLVVWYNDGGAPKLSGTVSIHDNIIDSVYSDCIQFGGIQTTTNVYNNTFSNFGENCADMKKSRYITIYNNDFSHNDFGEAGGGSKNTGPSFLNAGAATEFWIGYKNQDITIRDNYFHDCRTTGIDVSGDNWKIYQNYFKDVGQAVRMSIKSGTEVYNNVFNLTVDTDSRFVIYQKAAISGSKNPKTNCLIYNNSIYIPASNYLYGIAWMGKSRDSGNVIKNNIVYMMNNMDTVYPLYIGDYDGSNTFPTVDHNCLHNPNHVNRVSWDSTIYDSSEQADWRNAGHIGSLFTNPKFINPENGDFRLQSNSPAIDAGVDVGLPFIGSAPDMGAIEYTLYDPCEGVVCDNICIGIDMWSQKCVEGDCVPDQLLESNSSACGYDPCEGVVCDNICIGIDMWSQKCVEGDCVPDQLLESNSASCGYDPCEGVVCDNICIGKDLWSQKCEGGSCVPDQLLESNSVTCELCEGVVCGNTCVGDDLWSQRCDPDTGTCVANQLIQHDSINCKIPDQVPSDESTIKTYIILGGFGIMGLAMLMLRKQ